MKGAAILAIAAGIAAAYYFTQRDSGPIEPVEAPQGSNLQVEWISSPPDSLEDKPYALVFWATWCPPCVGSIPNLNRLHRQYQPSGFEIIGLSNEAPTTLRRFLGSTSIDYAVATDEANRYFQQFQVRGIPDAIVFDRRGRQVWRGHSGHLTGRIIEQALNQ